MWGELGRVLGEAVGRDIAEFFDLVGLVRTALRLLLAGFLGGLLGYERMIHRRPAGLRTYMLVALGSAAYVTTAAGVGIAQTDMSRVVQGLMTGIGFLGAGVIVKSSEQLRTRGLTTAAGIWLTAAVGMAVGFGRPATALMTTALALVVLAPMRQLESRVESRRHRHGGAGKVQRPT